MLAFIPSENGGVNSRMRLLLKSPAHRLQAPSNATPTTLFMLLCDAGIPLEPPLVVKFA